MGKGSAPAPAPPPQPTIQTVQKEVRSEEPANRAAVTRADSNTAKASLLQDSTGSGDVDPLTQRKQLAGGSASLMG